MLYKKIIGSLVFLFMILGISLLGYYFVQAKFINSQNLLEFDGLLTNVVSSGDGGVSTITLQTSGGEIKVIADNSTNYVGGLTYGDLDDAINDMRLRIVADIAAGKAYAKSIKEISGEGYGFGGDHVQITRAMVIDKSELNATDKWIKVDTGVAIITFHITTSTNFSGTTFEELSYRDDGDIYNDDGDIVQIHGRDSGNVFLASLVVLKEKKITTMLTK